MGLETYILSGILNPDIVKIVDTHRHASLRIDPNYDIIHWMNDTCRNPGCRQKSDRL